MNLSIKGTVIHGDGYGRKLGFPTANIDRRQFVRYHQNLKLGVYAGTVIILASKKMYRAGIIIGPLDNKGLPKLEAHLLDFSGDVYGQKLEFKLLTYLRPFKNFRDEKVLMYQIQKDLELVKQIKL